MFRRPNTMPPPPISKEIYSIGAYVRVDPCSTSQGGVGYVTAVHPEERKVNVNYIANSIGIINSSPFIDEGRLHAQSFDLLGGGDDSFTTQSGCCHCIEFGRGVLTAVV